MSETLLIDMDGVMADCMGRVFDIIEDEHEVVLTHHDVSDYWFKNLNLGGQILDIMRRPGFYSDLDVITGAVRGINRLREMYDVRVCSAPMKGSETCEDEKIAWLEQHFDQDFASEAIITPDKRLVKGKVLIEDNPDIYKFAGWRPLLFDQAWNRHARLPRMYGWHDLQPVKDMMSR